MSKQFLRYSHVAKDCGKQLFIALGVGGTPAKPEEFYLIPNRMFHSSPDVPKDGFKPYICEATAAAFYKYVCRYFSKRVLKIK